MGDGPPRFTRDSPCPALLRNLSSEPAPFRLPGCHRLWPIVPDRSTRRLVFDSPASRPDRPYNPDMQARRFGLFRVRSPLLAESLLFSFPAGTEMVHFPALSSTAYVFSRRYPGITLGGFPHSEISGSTLVCSSPKLIAACHVLHRLLAPRHPPYALSSLTTLGNWRTPGVGNIRLTPPVARRASAVRSEPREQRQSPLLSTTSLRKATVCRVFSCQIPAAALFRAIHGPKRPAATAMKRLRRMTGGEYRARTGDLLVANQALSQLS